MPDPSVTVLIRVLNGAGYLRKTLAALRAQHGPSPQIIVVDNESDDGTAQVAIDAGVDVINLPRGEFTYGKSLNIGIHAAAGDLVVILSAHSLPVGAHFLADAVAPFDDPQVAAVRLLHAGNRAELESWMKPATTVWPITMDQLAARGPIGCACAIRRSVWVDHPFDERIRSVEDKFWAYGILQDGYRIGESSAVYFYMRDHTAVDYARKMNKDRLAYYEQTGHRYAGRPQVKDLCIDLFYALPRRTIRAAFKDVLLAFLLQTIPCQSWFHHLKARARERRRADLVAGSR